MHAVVEQDTVTYHGSDEIALLAGTGDELITVDTAFGIGGMVDGGDGTDSCTSPAVWVRISC